MSRSRSHFHPAFTLVELLVVIAIIGVLVALLLPAVQAAREAARRSSCSNKLKQLAIALHNHHDTHNKLPPGGQGNVFRQPNPNNLPANIVGTSWLVFTLPFFEQQPLYDRYRFDLPYNAPENMGAGAAGTTVIPTLYCPSGPDARKYLDPNNTNPATSANIAVSTHYYGIMGPGGPTDNFTLTLGGQTYTYRLGSSGGNGAWSFHGMLSHYQETTGSISTNRIVRLADVIDGTTNTLMLGEISVHLPTAIPGTTTAQPNQYRTWVRGNNGGAGAVKNIRYPINSTFYNGSNNFNEISMASEHPGGAQFALGDASVRFISENIDLIVYQMSASMNGAENVMLP
jgi:prepilin-type N-terminal cleavage/methylation domain-containing protein